MSEDGTQQQQQQVARPELRRPRRQDGSLRRIADLDSLALGKSSVSCQTRWRDQEGLSQSHKMSEKFTRAW